MVIIKAKQPLSTKVSMKDFKSRFSGSELRAIDQSEQFLHFCVMTVVRDIDEGVYTIGKIK